MIVILLLACNGETDFNKVPAIPVISPSVVDFGEVVVGDSYPVFATLENQASSGYLTFSDPVFTTEDAAFSFGSWTSTAIVGGSSGSIELIYSPTVEGPNRAVLQLDTDAEDVRTVSVEMIGAGVAPDIELNPEQIAFGSVAAGSSVSESVQIEAMGTGNLFINNIELRFGDAAFSWSARNCELPCEVENGSQVTVDVVFAPNDDLEHTDYLVVDSTDPDEPQVEVTLTGNSVASPDNTPPVVEIYSPGAGQRFLSTASAPLTAHVYDPDEAATNLTCSWFANRSRRSALSVAGDGTITGSDTLPIGAAVEIEVKCSDIEGARGEDSVTVEVVDANLPLRYTLSGGDSLYDYFSVDDDITFYLNGDVLYADSNQTQDTLAPFEFDARVGDQLRIVATDQNTCTKQLTALVLHWGTGESQALNDEVCASACDDEECYSPDYSGPWPNTFFDQTFTISIP